MIRVYLLTSILSLLMVTGCYAGEAVVVETKEPVTTTPVVQPTSEIEASITAVTVATVTPTPTPLPTLTVMAVPTDFPLPTSSYTPILLPSPMPGKTKQVILQFGMSGGDGGDQILDYLGRNTPNLVLYSDGQVLFREGDFGFYEDRSGYTFKQVFLSPGQICSLLKSIADTGFFEIEGDGFNWTSDPIYEFDDSVEFSDGGPSYVIKVNGPTPKIVVIYYSYLPYVIDEVAATYDLLNNYRIEKGTPYKPDRVVLWIEEISSENVQEIQSWPENLPLLSELITSVNDNDYQGVLIEDNVESLLQLFDYRMKRIVFNEEDRIYMVAARPLLPHETVETFQRGSESVSEFPLPFECAE